MKLYTFDYDTLLFTGEIDVDIKGEYDPNKPGNSTIKKPPILEVGQAAKFNWTKRDWEIVDLPTEIIEQQEEPKQLTRQEQIDLVIRPIRDMKIRALQDRVDRFNNQVAGGIPTTETAEKIMEIYQVMQQLRDFPATVIDPWNPVWPDEGLE